MGTLGHGSINRRLTLTVMSTTAVALLAACVLFVLYDAWTGRERLVEKSEMLAQVIAKTSGVALAFRDEETASENLDGLAGARSVLAAAIYDADGERFVQYLPNEQMGFLFPTPSPRPSRSSELRAGRLHVFAPVFFGNEEVGSVYVALDASSLTTRIRWYAAIVGVVMLGAALFSAWVASRLRKQITEPLAALAEGTRAIASGDLSAHVDADRDDEIGVLAANFNEMAQSLRGVVHQTRKSIRAVSEVSSGLEQHATSLFSETGRQKEAILDATESMEQVSLSSSGLTGNAEQLASTSRETSTSIIEMDASIGEISDHMDHLAGAIDTTSTATTQVTDNITQVVDGVTTLHGATGEVTERLQDLRTSVSTVRNDAAECLELSEEASREAAEGRRAVSETVEAMGEISDSFGQLQEHVEGLADKSKSIDEIVQTIKNVAEQTGLLALNASIIAAQAGEHGRAFSVVAEQVSSLADRSHRSAREIAELIQVVQGDTKAAVLAVGEGSSVVQHGVQRSRVAGKVLNRIIDGTHTSTDRVRQIADVTLRQSDDLRRVDTAVQEVGRIVVAIGGSTKDQETATGEIARAVDGIRELGAAVRRSIDAHRNGSHQITSGSAHLADMATEIADALVSQSRGRQTVESALRVFNDVSETTSRGVEAMQAGVATLSERAKKLEEEVGSLGEPD